MNVVDRFVLVDWGYHETRIVVYERNGWALKRLVTNNLQTNDTGTIARAAAKLCAFHGAIPYVDVSGPGQFILEAIARELPPQFNPQVPVTPRML